MKTLTTLLSACALSLGLIGAAHAQAGSNDHATHHSAPGAVSEPASKPQMAPVGGMKNMEAHMQAMNGMHQKMVAAQTPEARQALMAEHMKSMPANGAGMQGCQEMMGSMMKSTGNAPSATEPTTSPAAKG